MKTTFFKFSILMGMLWLFNLPAISQSPGTPILNEGFEFNPEQVSCLAEADRIAIWNELNANIQQLKSNNQLFYNANRPEAVKFSWPLQKASNVTYNQIWGISNYVDHQPGAGIKDYNCGETTYNGHMGTDIYLWPFSWYAMDHFQGENIAAADGQIIAKHDGEQDRSCTMNGSQWNAVYLQHSDGSITWYGHMKKNSLTSKNIGDMVSRGEFLGNVGSSGSSTGPHLHFEVYDSGGNLIDPYQGSCNNLNSDSWWENQLSHKNPNINAALTHSAVPVFPSCPQQEIVNLENSFDVNETVIVALYLTDQTINTPVQLEIIKPNGTHQYNWNYTFDVSYQASYVYWTLSELHPDVGEWTWRATYEGNTVSHTFTVGLLGKESHEISNFKVFPNPGQNHIKLDSDNPIVEIAILDMFGRKVLNRKDEVGISNLNISNLSSGVYFIKARDNELKESVLKIIKE